MRPFNWSVVGRAVLAVVSVTASFTVGWLLAEALFLVAGRPPGLIAYLVAVALGIASGALASTIFVRLNRRGRGNHRFFDEIQEALDRVAHGDFDVHLDADGAGPLAEVVESVNKMARELGSVEQQRQDFVSNVSHEIHSPLTSIRGFAGLLREPGLDGPTRQHYLDIIGAECERLAGLSDNLLRLSALDDTVLDRSGFSLDDQVRDVILTLEPQWSGKGVEVELESLPVPVVADADLLRQVWVNLVQNAVKFTPSGGRVRVGVASDPSGAARVEVADTGIGIAAADLPHVFERFYRADKARGVGGNGLGLALAKRIVELHTGRIAVTSAPGQGATFTVRLP